jgi:hypothetical protein
MLRHFKKALIIAIAIVVVMWAWEQLKKDTQSRELMNRLKKAIN